MNRTGHLLRYGFLWLALFTAPIAFAGGSLDTETVLQLLKQNRDLHKLVVDTLELEPIAWATRIGTGVNKDLGGARIAPYHVRAKQKGSSGSWTFTLEVEAQTTFYDAVGKEVDLTKGVSIKEKLQGIQLIPIPPSEQE